MLARFALSGYRRNYDSQGHYTAYDRCEWKRTNPWYSTEINRITNWLNLLKTIEFKISPDVVAVYMIATGQGELCNSILGCNLDCVGCSPMPWSGADNLEHSGFASKFDYPDYLSDYVHASSKTFPPEFYKMARNYFMNRMLEFVNAIYDVCNDSDGALHRELKIGMSIPHRIVNALNAFTPTAQSINSVIEQIKSLYVTMMPPMVSDHDTYKSAKFKESVNKYASLKWDPSGAIKSGHPCDCGDCRERIGLTTINHWRQFMRCTDFLKNSLTNICQKDGQAPMAMEVKEAFVRAMEMTVYITCAIQNYSGTALLHLPEADEMNKLYFKDKLLENGAKRKNGDGEGQGTADDQLLCAYAWRNMSPAAAICVADVFTENLRNRYGYCYYWTHISEGLQKFFEELNPNPYGEVMSFLVGEYHYQVNQTHFLKEMSNRLKEEVTNGQAR